MASDDYTSIPSTGKLKLKGVKDSKVVKKKKHKTLFSGKEEGKPDEDASEDKSVVLEKLKAEDREMEMEDKRKRGKSEASKEWEGENEIDADENIDLGSRVKTEAERRYEEQRRKRLDDRLKREGVKTHKQRVEELNRYLSGLSEHHDMPRIGPG